MQDRIDVHHHILPACYVDAVGAQALASVTAAGRMPAWSVDLALSAMDSAGIAKAITSVSAPGIVSLSPARAIEVARECNDYAAQMAVQHPGRFGYFALLPMQDIEASCKEARLSHEAGALGVCLFSNYDGRYLGEACYEPLYDELNRLGSIVFMHPTAPQTRVDVSGMSLSSLEFPFDTTRTCASLILARVGSRYPRIRWIMSHAGGAAPYLAGRLDRVLRDRPAVRDHMPGGVSGEMKRFYFDTALSTSAVSMDALKALVSIDHILFGSDFPYGPSGQIGYTSESLEALDWSEDDKQRLRQGNASRLFSELRA